MSLLMFKHQERYMGRCKTLTVALVLLVFAVASAMATGVTMKLAGKGAVNETTIKAGEPVSVEIILDNDTVFTGFTMGFKLTSPNLKEIVHVADSNGGLNEAGDIKGYNGWHDQSVWDLNGVFVRETDWDGQLPDTIGFGGLSVKQKYTAHEPERKLSFDIMVPTTGTLVIDSAFFPPGGKWLYSAPARIGPSLAPKWGGPYKFEVVK
jgi:hypothetical protein